MLTKCTMFGGTVKITPFGAFVLVGSILVIFIFYIKSSAKKPTTPNEVVSLKQILAVGIELSERAGDEIRKIHDSQELQKQVKGKTKEGAKEYSTAADMRSHYVIVQGLQKKFPGIKVISEEHTNIPADVDTLKYENFLSKTELEGLEDVKESIRDVTVWVDPLDATQEFTENLLDYVTVLICIALKEKPLIGIIHQPFTKNTVWGWSGVGSSKNLEPSKTSSKQHRIIVSRSHAGDIKNLALKVFGNDSEIISAGGAGYKTLQIIQGKADAYVHVTLIKKWDICAPNAVLNSVDGKMTTIRGQDIDYQSSSSEKNDNGILATLQNHEEYLKLLKLLTN